MSVSFSEVDCSAWDSSDADSVEDPPELWERGVSLDLLTALMEEHNLENMSTRDVVREFVIPQTCDYECSLAGLMKRSYPELVGPATHYVIHSWDVPFERLVCMLAAVDLEYSRMSRMSEDSVHDTVNVERDNDYDGTFNSCAFFWIDIFAMDQNAHLEGYNDKNSAWLHRDQLFAGVRSTIERTRYACVFVEPLVKPLLVSRSWCLFEIALAILNGRNIIISSCNDSSEKQYADHLLNNIDDMLMEYTPSFSNSRSTMHLDTEWLGRAVQAIHNSGAHWVDTHVGRLLRGWLLDKTIKLTINCEKVPSIATLWKLGKELDTLERIDLAKFYLEQAFSAACRQYGMNYPLTLEIAHDLGCFAAQRLFKFEMAEELLRFVLNFREEGLGPDHSETCRTRVALARLLQETSEHIDDGELVLDEAEQLFSESFKYYLIKNGFRHRDTLLNANFLALLYQRQGQLREAYILLRRIVAEGRSLLGAQQVDVLMWSNNLAMLLQDMHEPVVAEKLFRRTLADSEQALGSNHPQTLNIVYNLAECVLEQGRIRVSEQIFKRELLGCQLTKGNHHPDTISSLENFISILDRQHKYDEIKQLKKDFEYVENDSSSQ